MYKYKTSGVCSKSISFEILNNKITNVNFEGGCAGNALGISSLVSGMTPIEVIEKLKGIKCGKKSTSCPDQLSNAIETLVL